ncbi:MAG: hypothetical protein WBL63_17850 [Candidatus Acidiferrum sp.]
MLLDASGQRRAVPFLVSAALGFVGGAICGGLILSFCYFIGRSGETPAAPVGTISQAALFNGALYGALLGAIAGGLAYYLVVFRAGFPKSLRYTFAGTLLGGFCGAWAAPPLAALTGMIGFFLAVGLLYLKASNPKL